MSVVDHDALWWFCVCVIAVCEAGLISLFIWG